MSTGQQTGSYCDKDMWEKSCSVLKYKARGTGAAIRTCLLLIFPKQFEEGQVSYFLAGHKSWNKQTL